MQTNEHLDALQIRARTLSNLGSTGLVTWLAVGPDPRVTRPVAAQVAKLVGDRGCSMVIVPDVSDAVRGTSTRPA